MSFTKEAYHSLLLTKVLEYKKRCSYTYPTSDNQSIPLKHGKQSPSSTYPTVDNEIVALDCVQPENKEKSIQKVISRYSYQSCHRKQERCIIPTLVKKLNILRNRFIALLIDYDKGVLLSDRSLIIRYLDQMDSLEQELNKEYSSLSNY